jgi:hypothetical protein
MVNVLSNLDLVSDWRRAVDGDVQWDEMFDGFEATVDWPGSFFYRELVEAFPDAKVVLGVRDGAKWAQSMRKTIWNFLYGEDVVYHLSAARAEVDPGWREFNEMVDAMWARSGLMQGPDTSDEWMAAAMERYHDEVRQNVPADRLLVWSVQEGWEPLCEFLEVPVPDTPFPHLNDSAEFGDRLVDAALITLQQWREQSRNEPAPAST